MLFRMAWHCSTACNLTHASDTPTQRATRRPGCQRCAEVRSVQQVVCSYLCASSSCRRSSSSFRRASSSSSRNRRSSSSSAAMRSVSTPQPRRAPQPRRWTRQTKHSSATARESLRALYLALAAPGQLTAPHYLQQLHYCSSVGGVRGRALGEAGGGWHHHDLYPGHCHHPALCLAVRCRTQRHRHR